MPDALKKSFLHASFDAIRRLPVKRDVALAGSSCY